MNFLGELSDLYRINCTNWFFFLLTFIKISRFWRQQKRYTGYVSFFLSYCLLISTENKCLTSHYLEYNRIFLLSYRCDLHTRTGDISAHIAHQKTSPASESSPNLYRHFPGVPEFWNLKLTKTCKTLFYLLVSISIEGEGSFQGPFNYF